MKEQCGKHRFSGQISVIAFRKLIFKASKFMSSVYIHSVSSKKDSTGELGVSFYRPPCLNVVLDSPGMRNSKGY